MEENNQSSGVNAKAEQLNVGESVVGRDLVTITTNVTEGGGIARMSVMGIIVLALVAIIAILVITFGQRPSEPTPAASILENTVGATVHDQVFPNSYTPTWVAAAASSSLILTSTPTSTFTPIPISTPTPTSSPASTIATTPSPTSVPTPSLTFRRLETLIQDANEALRIALLDLNKNWGSLQQYWCGQQAWKEIDRFKKRVKDNYGINVISVYTFTDSSLIELDGKMAYQQIETWHFSSEKVKSYTETRLYTYIFKKTSEVAYCIDEYLFLKPIK